MDDKQKIPLTLALYREVFPQTVAFFKNECEQSQIFYIPLSHLRNDEIKSLHECRQLFIKKQHEEMADILYRMIDRKLKVFLYNIFSILYGDFEHRLKALDSLSRANILNKTQDFGSNSSLSKNEFQRISTYNYCNLMTGLEGTTEGRRNWRAVFSVVFVTWQEEYLYDFLNVLISIGNRHSQKCLIDVDDVTDISEFMKQCITFIRSTNRMYAKIINEDYFMQKDNQITFNLTPYYGDYYVQPIQVSDEDS